MYRKGNNRIKRINDWIIGVEDLDFHIGDEAFQNQKTYNLQYPIRHGQIENWDLMERFWEQSIFKYMKCEPEDHYFLLVSYFFARIWRKQELLWSLALFTSCYERSAMLTSLNTTFILLKIATEQAVRNK